MAGIDVKLAIVAACVPLCGVSDSMRRVESETLVDSLWRKD
jgi:hypothetical protein